MGAHARMLRRLTELPGAPCVLVLCHPIKHVIEPAQLLPRGGGAFLAEMDGNLTSWKLDDTMVRLHHNKMRGPGFEPMTFAIDKIATPKLTDSKGRMIPTVRMVPITDSQETTQADRRVEDEDRVLARLLADSNLSLAEIATGLGWLFPNGDPAKSKVQKIVEKLAKQKQPLLKPTRNRTATLEFAQRERQAAEKIQQTAMEF
jgi:hypothetical protein